MVSLRKIIGIGLIAVGVGLGSYSIGNSVIKSHREEELNKAYDFSRVQEFEKKLGENFNISVPQDSFKINYDFLFHRAREVIDSSYIENLAMRHELDNLKSRNGFENAREEYDKLTNKEDYNVFGLLFAGFLSLAGLNAGFPKKS